MGEFRERGWKMNFICKCCSHTGSFVTGRRPLYCSRCSIKHKDDLKKIKYYENNLNKLRRFVKLLELEKEAGK